MFDNNLGLLVIDNVLCFYPRGRYMGKLAKACRQANDVPCFRESFGRMNGIFCGVEQEYSSAKCNLRSYNRKATILGESELS